MRAGPHVALRGKAITFHHTLVLPHLSGQIMTMTELTSQRQSNRILVRQVLPVKACSTWIIILSTGVMYCSTLHLCSILPVTYHHIQHIKSQPISSEQSAVWRAPADRAGLAVYSKLAVASGNENRYSYNKPNPVEPMRTLNTVYSHSNAWVCVHVGDIRRGQGWGGNNINYTILI